MTKKILVIAPHPDDAELWAGGTISRAVRQGKVVCVATLTHGDSDRADESLMAASRLGVDDAPIFGFEDKRLHRIPGLVRECLERLNADFDPDVVLIPPRDGHQDHVTVHDESLRAFREVSGLIAYHIPYNGPHPPITAYNGFNAVDMKAKIEAIRCHKSQLHRFYTSEHAVLTRDGHMAFCSGSKSWPFAEGFHVIRMSL